MRRFTSEERIALRTDGPPGEGPVSDATFAELERLGYGRMASGRDRRDILDGDHAGRACARLGHRRGYVIRCSAERVLRAAPSARHESGR